MQTSDTSVLEKFLKNLGDFSINFEKQPILNMTEKFRYSSPWFKKFVKILIHMEINNIGISNVRFIVMVGLLFRKTWILAIFKSQLPLTFWATCHIEKVTAL